MSDQILERFHRALIEEIQTQRPDYLVGAFSVAEIYQHLVPYGSHRDRIGVEMNGDYEDALIRLLAGEGGYLILDSEPALRDLRAELETPNPNTGLYREFAAVDVRLNQAYLDLSAAAISELPDLVRELEAEDPVAMAALAPSEGNADLGIVPPGVDIFGEPPEDSAGEQPVPSVDEATPDGGAILDDTPPVVTRPPLAPEFVDEPSSSPPRRRSDCRQRKLSSVRWIPARARSTEFLPLLRYRPDGAAVSLVRSRAGVRLAVLSVVWERG